MNRQQINDALKELYEFNEKKSKSIDCDELGEYLSDSNLYSIESFDDYRDDEAAFTVYELKNKVTGEKAFIQYQGEWNSWDSNEYYCSEFEYVIVDKRPVTTIEWCNVENE